MSLGLAIPQGRGEAVMKDEKGYPAMYWNTSATIGDSESWRRAESLMPQHRTRVLEKYDSLTRLPNAGLTRELLEIAIHRAQSNDRFASVLLIDVEPSASNTKADGKYETDVMLCKLACRLLACTSEEISLGQLARLEFALVVGARNPPEHVLPLLLNRIWTLLHPSVALRDEITLRFRTGSAAFPVDGGTADALVKAATSRLHDFQFDQPEQPDQN